MSHSAGLPVSVKRLILYTYVNNKEHSVDQEYFFCRLAPIFHEVLDNESIVLSRDLSADDVDEWDSLSHIRLIVAVEHAFQITFLSMEISDLQNVGDMIDALQKKLE
jgi:acyl carrier protein